MASNRGSLGNVEAILKKCRPEVAAEALDDRGGGGGGGPEKSDDKVRGLLRLMQATDRCATGRGEEMDARRKAGPAILLHHSITGDSNPKGEKGTVPRKDKYKKRADLRGSSKVSCASCCWRLDLSVWLRISQVSSGSGTARASHSEMLAASRGKIRLARVSVYLIPNGRHAVFRRGGQNCRWFS